MSEAGSVVWPSAAEPLWRFDWRLADYPDEEGIVIRSVRYRDRQMLYKASLPSLRVQYDGPCGPYKDPLHFNNAQPTSRCPGTRVCTWSYTSDGRRALVVESYHEIGAYRLTHRWIFWDHGWIQARLYSAGLQCNYNHRHHAYWRFDFDIEDSAADIPLEYNSYSPNTGWGLGWNPHLVETTRLKNPPSRRSWAVMDRNTGRGYHLIPGAGDGTANAFSTRDVWLLRYNGAEDRGGRQGSAADDALAPYVNGESLDRQDVVVWYAGHLFHEAAHGGAEWHSVGPDLAPFDNWS
jgi:Cu2+-containing amine oxidase